MRYVIMFLICAVAAAIGSANTLYLERSGMSFTDRVLMCAIVYGATIIGTLIVLGILVTRNYIQECKTFRLISRRLGLPN